MFIHSSIFTRIILDQCGLDRSPIRKYESYLGYMRAHFGCAVISLPPVILFNIIYVSHHSSSECMQHHFIIFIVPFVAADQQKKQERFNKSWLTMKESAHFPGCQTSFNGRPVAIPHPKLPVHFQHSFICDHHYKNILTL